MKHFSRLCATAVLVAAVVSGGRAAADPQPDTADTPHAVQGEDQRHPDQQQGSPPYHRPRPPYGYPYWDPWYGYYFFDPYGCYWPYGWPYYWDYVYLPPLYLPAEELYGPQAMKRFMGLGQRAPPGRDVNVIVVPQGGRIQHAAQPQRGANPRSVAAGLRYVGQGDTHFIQQKYEDAYQRYKKAAQIAPRLATPHFRQGWALIALGRYDLAAEAFKRGLKIDPRWAESTFRLFELYGPNQATKTAHVDALAKAAADKPDNGDLLFLVGAFLFFDGQPDRAGLFFERAAELTPGDKAHLTGFLAKAKNRKM